MNNDFISKLHKTAIYKLKPDTSSSYYYQSGEAVLPNRIGITKDKFAKVNQSGYKEHPANGQIKATYTKKEESIYKQFKPFNIHTSIYQVNEYSYFIGYGSIGISRESGRIHDTGDLIILYSQSASWEEVEIHFFPGLLKELPAVFDYLYKFKRCNQ